MPGSCDKAVDSVFIIAFRFLPSVLRIVASLQDDRSPAEDNHSSSEGIRGCADDKVHLQMGIG
jgi:hypothetical protein